MDGWSGPSMGRIPPLRQKKPAVMWILIDGAILLLMGGHGVILFNLDGWSGPSMGRIPPLHQHRLVKEYFN